MDTAQPDADWSKTAKKAIAERDDAKKKLREANSRIALLHSEFLNKIRPKYEAGLIKDYDIADLLHLHESFSPITEWITSLFIEAETENKIIARLDCPAVVISMFRRLGSGLFKDGGDLRKGHMGYLWTATVYLNNDLVPLSEKMKDKSILRAYLQGMAIEQPVHWMTD